MTTQLPVFSPAQLAVIASGGGGSVVLQSQGMQSYHITNRTGATLFMISDTGALLEMISPYSTRNDNIDQPTLTIRVEVNTSQPIVPSQNYPTSAWQCLYQLSPRPTDPSNSPMALEGIMSILGTVAVSSVPSAAASASSSIFASTTDTPSGIAFPTPTAIFAAMGMFHRLYATDSTGLLQGATIEGFLGILGQTTGGFIPLIAVSAFAPRTLANSDSYELSDSGSTVFPFPLNAATLLPGDATVKACLRWTSLDVGSTATVSHGTPVIGLGLLSG